MKGCRIDNDILNYLFDVCPLSEDEYQFTIKNLAVNKMSVPHLNQILIDKSIALTLDTLNKCIYKFINQKQKYVHELISFIETCLDISKWIGDELNMAFEIVLTPYIYTKTPTIWKTIGDLFITHGYDPLQHNIDVFNFSHQPGLLEYLVEIMDPDKLATILISRKKAHYDLTTVNDSCELMLDALEILANNGVDLNSLFRANLRSKKKLM